MLGADKEHNSGRAELASVTRAPPAEDEVVLFEGMRGSSSAVPLLLCGMRAFQEV
jgi:hypothetical protein